MKNKLKILSTGLALALTICLFAACGSGGVTLAGAKLALEEAGCTVETVQKSELPATFDDHQDNIKSAYLVTKGAANDIYLVEFNSTDDAVDAYTSIASNKQRAGFLIMHTVSAVNEAGDHKTAWDAFTEYANSMS